jgi:hypothetical protein
VGLAGVDGKDMAGTVERYGPATQRYIDSYVKDIFGSFWILLDLQPPFPPFRFWRENKLVIMTMTGRRTGRHNNINSDRMGHGS